MEASTPEKVFVIGHRNPDADSICSAIAYANLKNKMGHPEFTPARCGNSNARIDAILEHFDVPLPEFMGDVTPRLKDILNRNVKYLTMGSTCHEALELIDTYDIRALPVLDAEKQVLGSISIFSLGEYFIPKPKSPRAIRRVVTSVRAIVESLKAHVPTWKDPDKVEEMFVRVGAMDIRSFGKFSEEENIAPEKSIIIVGDRWDIQQRSIQFGVRLLVITGGLEVEQEVVELAREKGVSLIVSPYDSATTAWIIRSATLIDPMVEEKIPRFPESTKLDEIRRRISAENSPLYIGLDENQKMVGVFTKTDLLKPVRTQLVLVDHNELSQAVPGAHEVTIREIIDHHRLGNVPTEQPILFINKPVGSTCSIVAELFQREGVQPDSTIAGIMMSGLIADTYNLQSPTTTDADREIMKWLEERAGIKAEELSKILFSAGSIILSHPAEAVVESDCKVYTEGPFRFSVAQVEELGFNNFKEHRKDLALALEESREQKGVNFAALLVTDINSQNSILLFAGDHEIKERISYPTLFEGTAFDLQGIVSRKKQVIPYLTSLLRQGRL